MRTDMLAALSVELVNQVLASLDREELIRISHVSQRLRIIVCQYGMPCILRGKMLSEELAYNIWLAHVKSILDLDARIALVFEIYSSPYLHVHSHRLENWGYLLRAVSDLFSSTCNDGHGRIVALVAQLPHSYAEGLFSILPLRVTHLRELEIHGCWDSSLDQHWSRTGINPFQVCITSDLFEDGAPVLQSVSLRNVVLPSTGVHGFASTTYFHSSEVSLDDLRHQLALMPYLRSRDCTHAIRHSRSQHLARLTAAASWWHNKLDSSRTVDLLGQLCTGTSTCDGHGHGECSRRHDRCQFIVVQRFRQRRNHCICCCSYSSQRFNFRLG